MAALRAQHWRCGEVPLGPEEPGCGLAAGDRVLARSPAGELELTAVLSEDLPRDVAFSPKGRWPKLEGGRANVNALNPGTASDMGASTTVHGVEITLTRAPDPGRRPSR